MEDLEENKNEQETTFISDTEYLDQRSSVLKEYFNKYIEPGIDCDITGETMLTHSGYLKDNDVMIIQWIKHMYVEDNELKELLLLNENAICAIVDFADKKMTEKQIDNKCVTPKNMESIMKKSIGNARKELKLDKQLLPIQNINWFVKIKEKILKILKKD